ELHQVDKDPQLQNWLVTWCKRRPLTMLLALALIPHLLGSAVNIAYNLLHIMSELSAAQQNSFHRVVLLYNVVVYPLLVLAGVAVIRRVLRGIRRVRQEIDLSTESAAQVRLWVMGLPTWAMILSAAGWFP